MASNCCCFWLDCYFNAAAVTIRGFKDMHVVPCSELLYAEVYIQQCAAVTGIVYLHDLTCTFWLFIARRETPGCCELYAFVCEQLHHNSC